MSPTPWARTAQCRTGPSELGPHRQLPAQHTSTDALPRLFFATTTASGPGRTGRADRRAINGDFGELIVWATHGRGSGSGCAGKGCRVIDTNRIGCIAPAPTRHAAGYHANLEGS